MKNSNKSNGNSYENCNEIAWNIKRNIVMKLAEGCIKCCNEIFRILNKILQ
jgi:Ni,Fe-hydrogenase I small subunit